MEAENPGVMQCLEEALLAYNAHGLTFEIARYAAFLYVQKMTGLEPKMQAKFREIEDARMALQSSLIVVGGYRLTQQVFSFDPTITHELTKNVSSTFSDDDARPLPVDILERLPYSNFVVVPNLFEELPSFLVSRYASPGEDSVLELIAHSPDEGAWAHTAHIQLSPGLTLKEALAKTYQAASLDQYAHVLPTRLTMERLLSYALPLLLYLCAENRDVMGELSAPISQTRTKRGFRIFPAQRPSVAEVGVRIGAAVRAYRQPSEQGTQPHGGSTGDTKAPHMRSSHWHTYWTGSRSAPDSRKRVLHYLPPIPVNLDIGEEPPPVIRPVKV